jgi:phospholipase/carboxylesterase
VLDKDMKTLNHYTQEPTSGAKPKQIIVLLHGYGSNGRDLISLAPYWQPSVPEAIFVSPDAPFPCEMGGGAMNDSMRQWFSLAEYTPAKLLEGTQTAHPILSEYLDGLLKEYDLTNENMALVGFSQGTMMSLYTGLRRPEPIAGILGYSGALIGAEDLNVDTKKTPICLVHGEADSVVLVAAYHDAVKKLTDKGFDVSGHSTPNLEHSIDGQGIESGSKFLAKILNKNKVF